MPEATYKAMQEHWQRVHGSTPPDRTGWWESVPETSLALVERCGLRPDELIVDAGSGASTFVDGLLARGHDAGVGRDLVALRGVAACPLQRDRRRSESSGLGRQFLHWRSGAGGRARGAAGRSCD